jgi:hypothetical protein
MWKVSPNGDRFVIRDAAFRAIGDIGAAAAVVVPKLVDVQYMSVDVQYKSNVLNPAVSAETELALRENVAAMKRCAREALSKIGTTEALAALHNYDAQASD